MKILALHYSASALFDILIIWRAALRTVLIPVDAVTIWSDLFPTLARNLIYHLTYPNDKAFVQWENEA